MRIAVAMFLGVLTLTSCIKKKKETVEPINTNALLHEVTVQRALQANAYTYLFVAEGSQQYWVAVDKMEPQTGKTYYYADAMEMNNFRSTDLDTTFAQVFFVQKIADNKDAVAPEMAGHPHAKTGRKEVAQDQTASVAPAQGGITIAQLFAQKANYAGKQVIVSGKVVKVNNGIMDRNWVHLQDGTNANGAFDLTFTTDATVAPGDIVTFEGTVALDKDFGAGYFYDVIVEGAVAK
ncbi:MAG: hypothetical protein ACK5JD_02195 [Mangrovibacterium sp.]